MVHIAASGNTAIGGLGLARNRGASVVQAAVAACILDSLPASSIACGFRKLVSAYTGPAINVRRSSDNLAQDIGFASGSNALDTTALLAFVGAGNGYVTTMYDQSGGGHNLTQATVANQPRIVNAGVLDVINSKPAMFTDGVSMSIASGSVPVILPFTRSSVLKTVTNPGNKVALSSLLGATPVNQLWMPSTGALSMYSGVSLNIKAGILAGESATIVEIYNGAGSSGSYNGVGLSGDTGTKTEDGLRIGSDGANCYNGQYGEVIIFPSALSAGNKSTLEADQKSYYGL